MRNLDKPAVYLPALDRTLTLEQMFNRLEDSLDVEGNEYITWDQFNQYFEDGAKSSGGHKSQTLNFKKREKA